MMRSAPMSVPLHHTTKKHLTSKLRTIAWLGELRVDDELVNKKTGKVAVVHSLDRRKLTVCLFHKDAARHCKLKAKYAMEHYENKTDDASD